MPAPNKPSTSHAKLLQLRLFATPWTIAGQAPLSAGFSRREYWSGLPFPPAGRLPDPGIEPASPVSPASAGRFFTTSATWEALSTSPCRPKAFGSGRCVWDERASGPSDSRLHLFPARLPSHCSPGRSHTAHPTKPISISACHLLVPTVCRLQTDLAATTAATDGAI